MKISVFYEHIAEAAVQTGLPITEVLRLVKSFGIDGVEIENTRIINDSAIPDRLEDAGIMISCIYGFLNYEQDGSLKEGRALVELASALSVHNILLVPGFIDFNLRKLHPEGYEEKLANMIDYVKKVTEVASSCGITVGMEDFDDKNAPYSTIDGLELFANEVPGLKITFDTGNFLYSEEDVLEAYERLQPYIGSIHCKDRSFRWDNAMHLKNKNYVQEEKVKNEEEPKETVFRRKMYSASVGSGVIPMLELLTRLKQAGYDGTLAIEHFGSLHQLEDMRASAEWIRRIL